LKKRNVVIILGLLLGLALAGLWMSPVMAAPAAPIVHELTQPDGSTFVARQWGDEWSNGYETLAGYTILQNLDGWWVYAEQAPDESLQLMHTDEGDLIVGRSVPENIPLRLRPPRSVPESALVYSSGDRAQNSGSHPTLVILASFSDRNGTYTAANFASSFFGATNSVKDYYLKASFNQLTIAPAAETHGTSNDGVVGWLNLGYPHPNTGTSTGLANQQIVKDALIAADLYVNFAAFDTDGNGYISYDELHIIVVVAGYERAYSNNSPSVWAHHWSLNSVGPPVLDGKTIGDYNYNGGYAQFGEIHLDHQATIGIMIHELGHDLTWPDLYDIDFSSEGVGNWSIMGGGSWNYTSGTYQGSKPALPDAFLKYYQGWITPTQVSGTLTGASIPQAATNASAFLLGPNPNGVDWDFNVSSGVGEYFLVENRQLTEYDTGLPGCGLLIWHIDESVTSSNSANANENYPLVKLMEADGLNQLKLGINRGDAGDPFPGLSTNRTFNYSSTPNSRLYSGADSLAAVTNISDCAPTMTANLTYSGVSVPAAPTGVTASDGTFQDRVRVSWTASSGATYYQVFRNTSSSHSGETTLTSSIGSSPYDDTSAAAGQTYYYWVKACNSAGCSGYSAYNTGYRAASAPPAPTGVTASDGTFLDRVRVSWIASSGATYYQVFRNTSNSHDGETTLPASPPGSPFDDLEVVLGQLYYYWVTACNSAGCSGYSAVATGQLGEFSSFEVFLPLMIK